MTTPLNFIFEPLGTERSAVFGFWFEVAWLFVNCPNAAGAITSSRLTIQAAATGRNLFLFIVSSFSCFPRSAARALRASLCVGAIKGLSGGANESSKCRAEFKGGQTTMAAVECSNFVAAYRQIPNGRRVRARSLL